MAIASSVAGSFSMRSASTWRHPNKGLFSRWTVSAASIFDSRREYRPQKDSRALRLDNRVICSSRVQGLQDDVIPLIKEPRVRTIIPELSSVTLGISNESRNQDGECQSAVLAPPRRRWFPHAGSFKLNEEGTTVSTDEVLELLGSVMMDDRKQRIEKVVANRTYAVSVVVEGLSDVGNVSAVCRTADALGYQSVHVIANKRNMRYRENPRTSMGAEKWLDVEKWESTTPCLEALKARGYRIAVTHIADDTVSVHDMDWTIPTAIVLGNEIRGISEEAIALSDLRCSIPMAGMVESFNVSVAAAIVMHQAATDRLRRQGFHGDLTEEEKTILAADFFMRHRDSSVSILETLVARKRKRSRNRLKPEILVAPCRLLSRELTLVT
ncbi:hypothetical protein R1sor_001352 [Riccia sorocarpa]|uniref:tRNA/rRNA methyltransferase SpoU type domain-containing protein n=1 Tax=Riccia sorocarpa TaxID=122646 RepID=A0ABD3GYV7_9MARC